MVFDHAFAEQFTIRLWSLLVSVVFARKASLGFHFWPSILGLIMMTITLSIPNKRPPYSRHPSRRRSWISETLRTGKCLRAITCSHDVAVKTRCLFYDEVCPYAVSRSIIKIIKIFNREFYNKFNNATYCLLLSSGEETLSRLAVGNGLDEYQ